MPKDVTVESFELDHTIVKAPYVRLISEEVGPKGDIITNFDIRLIQPKIVLTQVVFTLSNTYSLN